jgi:hypothetical protein
MCRIICRQLAAQALATRLKQYWAERGFDIKVGIETATTARADRSDSVSCIRSNLVAGLPS